MSKVLLVVVLGVLLLAAGCRKAQVPPAPAPTVPSEVPIDTQISDAEQVQQELGVDGVDETFIQDLDW